MSNYSRQVRRKDRQKTDPQFLIDLLRKAASCSIAVERDGYPLNHVAFFVYDEQNHEIIFHFSKHGFAGDEITNGKKVSVSVYRYGKLYTADRAVDFGCEYQSIIIYGTIRVLDNEDERMEAMRIFFDKFFPTTPKDSYTDFTPDDTKPIHVVRVKIEDWFAKEHLVPEKAKSSFYYPVNPVIG